MSAHVCVCVCVCVCARVHGLQAGIWRLLKIIPCSNEMAILALLQGIIM